MFCVTPFAYTSINCRERRTQMELKKLLSQGYQHMRPRDREGMKRRLERLRSARSELIGKRSTLSTSSKSSDNSNLPQLSRWGGSWGFQVDRPLPELPVSQVAFSVTAQIHNDY